MGWSGRISLGLYFNVCALKEFIKPMWYRLLKNWKFHKDVVNIVEYQTTQPPGSLARIFGENKDFDCP